MKKAAWRWWVPSGAVFLTGLTIYLSDSKGPVEVRVVTVFEQLLLLASASYVFWVPDLRPRTRAMVFSTLVLLVTALIIYLDGFVLPQHSPFASEVAARFMPTLIEALLFCWFVAALRVLSKRELWTFRSSKGRESDHEARSGGRVSKAGG